MIYDSKLISGIEALFNDYQQKANEFVKEATLILLELNQSQDHYEILSGTCFNLRSLSIDDIKTIVGDMKMRNESQTNVLRQDFYRKNALSQNKYSPDNQYPPHK